MSIEKSEIEKNIFDYLDRENTNYAVLISGDWGSGKTYYWKNTIEDKIKASEKLKPLYISLNGLDKTEEIGRKIVTTYWKTKTSEKMDLELIERHKSLIAGVASITKSMGGMLSSLGDIASSLVKIELKPENMVDYIDFSKIVLCFDDLERFSDIEKALGFINDFVESKQVKTIILSNEDMLSAGYAIIKEKVIGKTIKFAINKKEILGNIINTYFKEDIKDFYIANLDLIVEMMICNNSCNYRVIRTILDDFYVVYKRKDEVDDAGAFQRAQSWLLKYILAVGLEFRVNGICDKEKNMIKKMSEESYLFWTLREQGDEEKPEPYHIIFRNRYYKNDFEGRYFFNSVFEYLNSAFLDVEKLKEEISLYADRIFTPIECLFQVGYWKMTDVDFDCKIKKELLNDIEEGAVALIQYPRIFRYYATFQEYGILDESLEDLKIKFYRGMEKIKEKGIYSFSYPNNSNVGAALTEEAESVYQDIIKTEIEVRRYLQSKDKQTKSKEFIDQLKIDAKKAIAIINTPNNSMYNSVSLFQTTNVEELYEVLCKLPNEQIIDFRNMLMDRYEFSYPELDSEYKFIKQLAEHIQMQTMQQRKIPLSKALLKMMAIDIDKKVVIK